jgi:UDP-glucose:glycoprotein glucosyltransferase
MKEENFLSQKPLEDLIVGGMDLEQFLDQINHLDTQIFKLSELFAQKVVQLKVKENLVIANGRLYGPLNVGEEFTSEDYRLLERLTTEGLAQRLADQLSVEDIASGDEEIADLTMKVSSVFMLHSSKEQQSMLETQKRVHFTNPPSQFSLRLYGDFSQPTLDVLVVLDPLTREAQRISHMLLVMRQALNCNFHIIFNPKYKHSESPLKSFYRYVWPHSSIDGNSPQHELVQPKAHFTRLPGQPLLTMAVDAPHSWMV